MTVDFFTLLDTSNSIVDHSNEITVVLTSPVLEINDNVKINKSCKLSSNCNTLIKCKTFEISSSDVSISDINFEGAILVNNSNNFSIKNSTIKKSENIDGSLTVISSKDVFISHVTISESNIPGLYLKNESTAQVDNLLIHDISESLLVCNSFSSITIRDSKLEHSKANGIYSSSKKSIEILNCTFCDIAYPAIYIDNTKCIVKDSTFDVVKQDGIALHNATGFSVENCKFNHISGSAISAGENSQGVIKGNKLLNVEGNGIFIKKSEVHVEKNEISGITFPAIAVIIKSKATLFDNKVSDIKHNGIACRSATDVTIEKMQIEGVNESAISISDTENCVVKNNTIKNCSIAAVEVYNKSHASAFENDIKNIEKYAFMVYTSGFLKSEKNRIEDVKNSMVKLAFKGSGEFINNTVINCQNQCEIQTTSPFFFDQNGDFAGITNQKSMVSEKVQFDQTRVDDNSLCLKCDTKNRDCFLLDCGHNVYCKECAKLALKNGEVCPLCRFPIVNISNGFGVSKEDTCIICCENHPDCIVIPCGHMGVCSSCLESWFETKQVCPICRAENSIYKKIEEM